MPTRGAAAKHKLAEASPAKQTSKKTKSDVVVPIPDEFKLLDRYWKASNYLSVGQVSNAFGESNCESNCM
jgi:Phosphoketolase